MPPISNAPSTPPRRGWRPVRRPWPSLAIHGGAALLFVLLATRAFAASNLAAWSAGFAYLLYDTALIALVFRQTLPLLRPIVSARRTPVRPKLASSSLPTTRRRVLPITLRALLGKAIGPTW